MASVKPRKALILVVIAIAALSWWFNHGSGDAEPLQLYGNVDIREVEMAFRQPGRLMQMAFDEGDRVHAGDLVAELDGQPYRDALHVTEAEVRKAQAEVEKRHRGNRAQEIAKSAQSVRQAEAAFHFAEIEYQRQNASLPSGAASQQAVDAARSQRDQARATLEEAKQELSLKKEGYRKEDIVSAEAQLAAARASLAQAQTALADTRLIAPADGIILSRIREPGSMVNASTPVYSLSLRNPIYIRAYVTETNLGQLAPGTVVSVHTDSSDKVYRGQIGFVSPRAEFTPKSVETAELRTDLVYRLRIVVADADDGLRQGMPVTVQVDTGGGNR
ncbi:MAG: secretion protein HlyD [Gammaproteobacteria bacterium]